MDSKRTKNSITRLLCTSLNLTIEHLGTIFSNCDMLHELVVIVVKDLVALNLMNRAGTEKGFDSEFIVW